ncbi:MAG TPA: dephospho-CoA kinase [Chloroflexota bacterium]|nr:dephospho-CoA kinase [Chloroflexota bacterium]
MPFLLGLTGNIACGKSSVGQLLAERFGADYVDADRLVHQLYAAGTSETRHIAERFGTDLLQQDGTIDRRRLGDRVLLDPRALRELEAILNPGVRKSIEDHIASSTKPVVVLDAIRLIEAGLAQRCDAVWVVTCTPEIQQERLQASRGMSAEQARLRVESQRPQAEKIAHATRVIDNTGDLVQLQRAAQVAWDETVAPYLVQSSPP